LRNQTKVKQIAIGVKPFTPRARGKIIPNRIEMSRVRVK
jgi:hypothetical protein